jgi:hypothetical protein
VALPIGRLFSAQLMVGQCIALKTFLGGTTNDGDQSATATAC